MNKEWRIKASSDETKSILAKLLEVRGIVKDEDINEFLNPSETEIVSPYSFCDMEKAVERIKQAISSKEKILIYGDFDADGITSTSLLMKTFQKIGAEVDYFIPDREKHGHGLNFKALVKVMAKRKPKLIITVDCGISNEKEVSQLKAFGIDTIITDHHEAPEVLPQAIAIINPKAPFKLNENLSSKEIFSLTSMAGVGVAFKLACALLDSYDSRDYILSLIPFVTVGTISDIVPLVHENRFLVSKGLGLISKEQHYGIKRLLEEAGYKLENGVTSEQIAFGVTPRINATGRLDNVDDSVKVLISDNKKEIELAIMSLNNCNKIRQELCDNIFAQAKEMRQNENSIILMKQDWHIGIIGIVASKLTETYNKPAFLMSYSDETKQIRCSARGVEGLNIYDILSANAEYFDNYGGHAMAGGFAFNSEKYSFEQVKKALDTTINEFLGGAKLKPVIDVDLKLKTGDLSFDLISDIEKMEPFGAENPSPLFAQYNLKLVQKKLMGSKKNHLKLVVEDENHNRFDCIWWSRGDINLPDGSMVDLVFSPQVNEFNGNKSIQLIIKDLHSDKLVENTVKSQYVIYDHRKKTGIYSNIEDYLRTTKLKVGVFAEDKRVVDELKSYPVICDKIIKNIYDEKYDSIMFFDYPASQESFESILSETEPRVLHFMKFEPKEIDEKDSRVYSTSAFLDDGYTVAAIAVALYEPKRLAFSYDTGGMRGVAPKMPRDICHAHRVCREHCHQP